MKYPDVYYKATQYPDYLEHYNFDGTYRGVLFRDAEAASAALLAGRAEVDCSAIEQGLLPRGAYLVSRAAIVDLAGPQPLTRKSVPHRPEMPRARFAIGESGPGGEYTTEERDEKARGVHPTAARRYDALADTIEKTAARRNADP